MGPLPPHSPALRLPPRDAAPGLTLPAASLLQGLATELRASLLRMVVRPETPHLHADEFDIYCGSFLIF